MHIQHTYAVFQDSTPLAWCPSKPRSQQQHRFQPCWMAWLRHALGRLLDKPRSQLELAQRIQRRYSQASTGAASRQACCCYRVTPYFISSRKILRASGVLPAASCPSCRVRTDAVHPGAAGSTLQHPRHGDFSGQVISAWQKLRMSQCPHAGWPVETGPLRGPGLQHIPCLACTTSDVLISCLWPPVHKFMQTVLPFGLGQLFYTCVAVWLQQLWHNSPGSSARPYSLHLSIAAAASQEATAAQLDIRISQLRKQVISSHDHTDMIEVDWRAEHCAW